MTSDERPAMIPAWRFTAGVMAHVVPLMVLLAAIVAVIGSVVSGGKLEDVARTTLSVASATAGVTLTFGVLIIAIVAITDKMRTRRREWMIEHGQDADALRSRRNLETAIRTLRKISENHDGIDVTVLKARMEDGAAWNHDHPDIQAVTRDMAVTIDMASTSMTTMGADERSKVVGMTMGNMTIMVASAEMANRRQSRGGVERIADHTRYIAAKYDGGEGIDVP